MKIKRVYTLFSTKKPYSYLHIEYLFAQVFLLEVRCIGEEMTSCLQKMAWCDFLLVSFLKNLLLAFSLDPFSQVLCRGNFGLLLNFLPKKQLQLPLGLPRRNCSSTLPRWIITSIIVIITIGNKTSFFLVSYVTLVRLSLTCNFVVCFTIFAFRVALSGSSMLEAPLLLDLV